MFEQRMALLEGAEAVASDRHRHGRGHSRVDEPRQGRRSCRGGARAVRLVPLCRRGMAAAFRRDLRPWSMVPISINGAPPCGRTRRRCFSRRQPTRHSKSTICRAIADHRACQGGAKLVVDNVFATPLAAEAAWRTRRRCRRLFRHQTYRRAGAVSWWRDPLLARHHRYACPQCPAPDRARSVTLQRLGAC